MRTVSPALRPISSRSFLSPRSWTIRSAASSLDDTRNPFTPSWIWRRMPPTFPPMTARLFHIPSATVKPKPSRNDFCNTIAERVRNAFTREVSSPLVKMRMRPSRQAQSELNFCAFSRMRWTCSLPITGSVIFEVRYTMVSHSLEKARRHMPSDLLYLGLRSRNEVA